jgi:hypothetical protein
VERAAPKSKEMAASLPLTKYTIRICPAGKKGSYGFSVEKSGLRALDVLGENAMYSSVAHTAAARLKMMKRSIQANGMHDRRGTKTLQAAADFRTLI